MASLIEGYNYDIFISYRQKDNKGDRWVSKFVDALKTELEATFKEDISVYFDENPHDRLQETHNVDKSLEGKLNCLIFLPILSQTYCDPNSYAWQYEFLAFLRMTEQDRFGKDIKLRSGNVASRILPIRIHDLEQEDIKLFEKETGSVLRAMDFVYKTASGVNRSLQSDEDRPNDNLNRTLYRDQINKVAHAIKEIILGMKTEPVQVMKKKDKLEESFKEIREKERRIDLENPAKAKRGKILIPVAIVILLIVSGIIAYPKLFKRDSLESLREKGKISVAVMPFQNMTNDTSLNIWQDGIQDILITSLSNSDELTVRPVESVKGLIQSKGLTDYASITPSIASRISKKLDAKLFVYGSMHQSGNSMRLNVQLIDARTNELFKSFHTDTPVRNGIDFSMIDSISTGIKNFLILSNLIEENRDFSREIMTNSPDAYKFFMLGLNVEDNETKLEWFKKALDIDSNFINAESYISAIYWSMGMYEQGREWFQRVYNKRDKMAPKNQLWMERKYAQFYGTPDDEIKQLLKLKQIDDQDPNVYYNLGIAYNNVYQYEKAVPELEKYLEIKDKWNIKPPSGLYYYLGSAYQNTGQYRKARNIYEKGLQDFPDNSYFIYRQAVIALFEGHTVKANRYFEEWISKWKTPPNEADINNTWAQLYSEGGILDKAEECYRKALSIQPDNVDYKYFLGKFLIDKNRDVNQGMELISQLIKSYPERYQNNYQVLDCYGWGLYKQRKYQEALDTLQKSWDLRREKAIYDHEAFLHFEAAKKALANQKNN